MSACIRTSLIAIIVMVLAMPMLADAKPPGGIPPGQAKKMGHGKGQGPPAHAPAHGYRNKYKYKYWPEHNVYYDPGREIYFYREGGRWVEAPEPPTTFRLNLPGDVSIEMETPNPFDLNSDHMRLYR